MNDFYGEQMRSVENSQRLKSHYDRVDRLINSTNNQNTDSLKDLILNRAKSELNIKDLKLLANYIEQKANGLSEDKASVLYALAADLYITPQQPQQSNYPQSQPSYNQQQPNNYPQEREIPQLARNFIPQLPEGYSLNGEGISITGPNDDGSYSLDINLSRPKGKYLKEIRNYNYVFKNNSGIIIFNEKFTNRTISRSTIDYEGNCIFEYNGMYIKINVTNPINMRKRQQY